MGVFEQNLERIKSDLAQNYGTPHGKEDHILLGHTPSARLVPFKDGVRVIQGSGNQYDAGSWSPTIQVSDSSDGATSTAYLSREMFFQFAEPVNDIKSISFPWSNGDINSSNSSDDFGTQQTGSFRARVGLNLMRFDMSLGQPLGLDALTGANAAWGKNTSAHGSVVYATPSNFDDFSGRGAELWRGSAEITVSEIIGGSTKMGLTSLGWAGDPTANNEQMLGVSFSTPKTDGPYFGIHVFYHSGDLSNDPLFFWDGTIDYTIVADLLSPRPGVPHTRGHVIGSPLLSF